MLEVKNGSFAYPGEKELFRQVSFTLQDGEIMTILGQNGIGKTTLLKCVTGIYKWTDGGAFLNGRPVSSVEDLKGLGYVPQAHPLSFSYSIREIVTMGRARYIRAYAVPSKRDRELAEQAMEEVGIADLADRSCTSLSGGQLQLAFIARALAGNPEIMILDEPESHLDFKNQFLILQLIERLSREKGISCLINTHFPEHALQISDCTLLMGRNRYLFGQTGEVITEKSVEEFFGIRCAIQDVPYEKGKRKSFVVLDLAEHSETGGV